MRNNYIEILNTKIEIPIIQRDYAQGRTDSKTNRIRKDFLDALFELLTNKYSKDKTKTIELDFIYGFNQKKEVFIPLDGQQRLTTLWLLYWIVATKENPPATEKTFLHNFLYETRHSTTEFCKRLLGFQPAYPSHPIDEQIKNQPWYFETWDFDPCIQSMLVVLKDLEERYENLNLSDIWSIVGPGSCPFYFYKLEMKEIGLKDDLYIKMNSRGKPLTEFEYFKAGFSELLSSDLKDRFEKFIDGIWIDTVWDIVHKSGNAGEDKDIAIEVDNSFLNLFNFITSVLASKQDIKDENGARYIDTENSPSLLKKIYSDTNNQRALFEILDAIHKQHTENPDFWSSTFYTKNTDFSPQKSRLFFQHGEVNLLNRCLFNLTENRGITLPEQVLLYACFTHLKAPTIFFPDRIRTIRNLAVNSDNELRIEIIGYSFAESEQYILTGNLDVFSNFKTDQVKEEKEKQQFLTLSAAQSTILKKLEDTNILRGSISIIPLDANFGHRAGQFLNLFNEETMVANFITISNQFLSFGDYTQDDGLLTNMMAPSQALLRDFLTTPGYNKDHFSRKTQPILAKSLDYYSANPSISPEQRIKNTLADYETRPKDWQYYFIKYPGFRDRCNKGYYTWDDDNHYPLYKMKEKRTSGYHWDPFLYEIAYQVPDNNASSQPAHSNTRTETNNLSLEDYAAKLILTHNDSKIAISTLPNAFLFESELTAGNPNPLLTSLIQKGKITSDGLLLIPQNEAGIDLNDRIVVLKQLLLETLTH